MGKTRTRKTYKSAAATNAVNPIPEQTTPDITQQVQPMANHLWEKLKSNLDEEKEWACASLANLVFDEPEALQMFLNNNSVKLLVQLLLDKNIDVQIAAAGALRNFAIAGMDFACNVMLQADVMTSLLHLFSKCLGELQKISNNPSENSTDPKSIFTLVEQLISILWNLCENFDRAIAYLEQNTTFLPNIMECLNLKSTIPFPPELVVLAAQCVNTIAEDNEVFAKRMLQYPQYCDMLIAQLGNRQYAPEWQTQGPLLRVLLGSIVYHLRSILHASSFGNRNVSVVVLPLLSQTLQQDGDSILIELCQPEQLFIRIQKMAMESEKPNEVGNMDAVSQEEMVKLKKLDAIYSSLLIALQQTCNIATLEEDEDAMEEDARAQYLPEDISNMILSAKLHEHATRFCQPPPLEMMNILLGSKMGTKYLQKRLQILLAAIDAIGNMTGGMQNFPFRPDVSTLLCKYVDATPESDRIESVLGESFIGSVLNSLRSCLRLQLEKGEPLSPSVADFVVYVLRHINIEKPSTTEGVLGVLGILAPTAPRESILSISILLAQLLNESEKVIAVSLPLMCEALNAVFDVFSEADHDDIFKQQNYPASLKTLAVRLKRVNPRTLPPQDADQFEETLENLIRFIEYKQQ